MTSIIEDDIVLSDGVNKTTYFVSVIFVVNGKK